MVSMLHGHRHRPTSGDTINSTGLAAIATHNRVFVVICLISLNDKVRLQRRRMSCCAAVDSGTASDHDIFEAKSKRIIT